MHIEKSKKVMFYFFPAENEDDDEYWYRGCEESEFYNDEEDKCENFSAWGVDYSECVCDEDDCNSGSMFGASLVLVVSAALRQLVL